MTGSSTLAPLIAEIAQRYEQAHPEVRIDVQTGGSSRGIRDARQGAADIGMASRDLLSEEQQGVATDTIAWDGVAFVVHGENPVVELTRTQLQQIYTGLVQNWQEVGGVDAPIIVSSRAAGRSELELVTAYLKVSVSALRPDVIDGETQQSLKTVATNRHAITYTSLGAARHAAAQGVPLKLLPLAGVPAELSAVQSGRYPLARPLLLIRPLQGAGGSELARAFVEYALSPAVDDLTRGLGYVPPNRQ